jgi:anaerobic ribonucleoside-triphosphate reductase activating protein
MQIERIFYPIEALGPGNRLVIWTVGCSKRCPKCISRELWGARPDKNMPITQLINFVKNVIDKNAVDGITISGGDPLEQREELLQFISGVYPLCNDILIYTGYTLNELRENWKREDFEVLIRNTTVLIDGRYIDELNDNTTPLIGSSNQVIHFFEESKRNEYERYIGESGRIIQNIYSGTRLISVGIHNKETR